MKQYLENLIRVVNNEDWEKFKKIELKESKLKELLHILLDNRLKLIPPNRQIQEQLKIDDKLHRKMKSVLLVKCYETLAPEGNIQLLELLSRYRLYNHFIRETEKQEKSIEKKPLSERYRFYAYVFMGLTRLPYSLINIELLKEYGDKYLKTVSDKELHEQTWIVRIRIFTLKILHHFFNMQKAESSYHLMNELLEISNAVKEKTTVTLESFLNLAAGMFYYYVNPDYSRSLRHLLLSKKDLAEKATHLSHEEQESVEVFIALNYYKTGKFSEALNILSEAEKKYPEILKLQTHVINRMIELHLIQGNIKEAKLLLDNIMKRFLDISEHDSAALASISYIKYYLLKDNLNNAFLYLSKSREFLNKKFFVKHEIEVRLLEIIYFIYSGDYAFALILAKRGIKFLNEKTKSVTVKHYSEKFKVLQQICKATDRNNPPEQKIIDDINQVFNGYDYLSGILALRSYRLKLNKME